jgi:hypothetical protein
MMTMLNRERPRLRLVLQSVCLLVTVGVCLSGEFSPRVRGLMSSREVAAQKEPEWQEYAVEGISYRVARSSLRGKLGKPGSHQDVLVSLEPNVFTEDRALRVFRHISIQVPRQTTLFVTILTDRKLLNERVKNPRGDSSLDDEYSRLTDQPQHCCPATFKGAQIERYSDRSYILVCDAGKAKELCVGEKCGPGK